MNMAVKIAASGMGLLALLIADLWLCSRYGFNWTWCFICFLTGYETEGPTKQRADDLRGERAS